MAEKNPIVEVYKGIPIRRCNFFRMRMNNVVFKMLILESERTGMPISKILAYSSKPCSSCENIDVTAYNADGQKVDIPRGILYKMKPNKRSGVGILKQHHAKKQ